MCIQSINCDNGIQVIIDGAEEDKVSTVWVHYTVLKLKCEREFGNEDTFLFGRGASYEVFVCVPWWVGCMKMDLLHTEDITFVLFYPFP